MKTNLSILNGIIALCLIYSCQKDEVRSQDFYDCALDHADSSTLHPKHAVYQQLLNEMVASGVPGVQLSIRQPGYVEWNGAAGKADLGNDTDLEPCHLTRVGSTVKTFTAVTMLLLQEDGKLDLDDPVSDYLAKEDLLELGNAEQATLRQLLQHSAGLYNYMQNLSFQTASINDLIKEWTPGELLAYARGRKAYFSPGEDVAYSNTGYVLLGMVISKVEEKPFYQVFKERLFDPMGLSFTQFSAEDPVPNGIARGYVDFYSNLEVINATYYSGWDYYQADGGLISNAHDLNHFLTTLFSDNFLSETSLEELTTWQTPSYLDPGFYEIGYGLGVFKMETPWGVAWFHSGDAIGYYANMVYFPEQHTTITWAVNGNYGKIDQFTSSKEAMDKVFSTVFGR